jgi:hypothetical protein
VSAGRRSRVTVTPGAPGAGQDPRSPSNPEVAPPPADFDLQPGDVLSYSAGSTRTGPEGFRKLRAGKSLLGQAAARWPELLTAPGSRPVLFINAYPATIGTLCEKLLERAGTHAG